MKNLDYDLRPPYYYDKVERCIHFATKEVSKVYCTFEGWSALGRIIVKGSKASFVWRDKFFFSETDTTERIGDPKNTFNQSRYQDEYYHGCELANGEILL